MCRRSLLSRACVAIRHLVFLAALFWSGTADAQARRALLVGVSDYPAENGVPDLGGPVNDVRLVESLLKRAWGDGAAIGLLTTGGPADATPTRAAILAALDALVADAGVGDDVLIYLAGHGARLPPPAGTTAPEEEDGLNEAFLPADVTLSRDGDGGLTVRNHIVDDEIGARIAGIMAKGAAVWLIADTLNAFMAIPNLIALLLLSPMVFSMTREYFKRD